MVLGADQFDRPLFKAYHSPVLCIALFSLLTLIPIVDLYTLRHILNKQWRMSFRPVLSAFAPTSPTILYTTVIQTLKTFNGTSSFSPAPPAFLGAPISCPCSVPLLKLISYLWSHHIIENNSIPDQNWHIGERIFYNSLQEYDAPQYPWRVHKVSVVQDCIARNFCHIRKDEAPSFIEHIEAARTVTRATDDMVSSIVERDFEATKHTLCHRQTPLLYRRLTIEQRSIVCKLSPEKCLQEQAHLFSREDRLCFCWRDRNCFFILTKVITDLESSKHFKECPHNSE